MQKNVFIQLIPVRHRAALNCVLAEQMNIVLQQESLFTLIPCHLYGIDIFNYMQQKLWNLLLKYYIHSLSKHVIQGGTMAD